MPLGRLTALLTAQAPTVSRLIVALKLSSADKSNVAVLPPAEPLLPSQTWMLAFVLLTLTLAVDPEMVTPCCCAGPATSTAPTVNAFVILIVRPLARRVL